VAYLVHIYTTFAKKSFLEVPYLMPSMQKASDISVSIYANRFTTISL